MLEATPVKSRQSDCLNMNKDNIVNMPKWMETSHEVSTLYKELQGAEECWE